jgi:CheY-like chemotaxis protein
MPDREKAMEPKKKSILIIDDEKDTLKSISDYLKRKGYIVDAVDNGQKGLELVGDQRPDLVILDLMLPDIDGSDIAAHLLEDPLTCHTPVIFLTGILRKSEQPKLTRASAKRCIMAKPCTPKEILDRVKDMIGAAEIS